MTSTASLLELSPLEAASTATELQKFLLQEIQSQRAALLRQQRKARLARALSRPFNGQPYNVSAEDFSRALRVMRAHYTEATTPPLPELLATRSVKSPVEAFKLPSTLVFQPVSTDPCLPKLAVNETSAGKLFAGDMAVDAMVAEIHSTSLTLIQQHTMDFLFAAKNTQAQRFATAAWLRGTRARRAGLKATLDRQRDALFDKALKIGNLHSDQRLRVLAAANYGSALVCKLYAGLVEATQSIARAMLSAENAATSTLKTVALWATSALRSVAGFRCKLF